MYMFLDINLCRCKIYRCCNSRMSFVVSRKKLLPLIYFNVCLRTCVFLKKLIEEKKLENPSAKYPNETKNKIQKLFALILVVSKYQAKKQQENKINNLNNNLYECKMFFIEFIS